MVEIILKNTTLNELCGGGDGSSLNILLTESEVAAQLRLSKRTLQAWRVSGEGPRYLKLSGAVRYRSSDIAAWIEQSLTSSTSATDEAVRV